MSKTLIKAADLGFSYKADNGDVEVLKDIDLSIKSGSFTSIIGPSGCGKTSLLRLIAGLEKASSGSIQVDTQNSAYVFQQPALFPWATVQGNIAKPLKLSGASDVENKVNAVLDLVGLSGSGGQYPHQLSGGMQQRVSIARALVMEPDLLLMDEPFGALDEQTRESMNLELRALWKATEKTVCFVTHSISEAVFLSTDILVLSSKPERIKAQFKSALPAIRGPETFTSQAFNKLVAEVRSALRED